jgi:peptidoglycan-N-acetylglucosamine deacetylase
MTQSTLKYEVLGFLRHFRRFPFLYRIPTNQPTLYLTFDDGPVAGVTDALLNLLATHQVKATFFCIGNRLQPQHTLAERVVREGHLLANHSFSHRSLPKLTTAQQVDEINKTDTAITDLTAFNNRHFRAPYGHWTFRTLLALWQRGKVPAHWSYDSNDFTKQPAAVLIERFKRQPVVNGDIILLHDDAPLCIEILDTMIPHWRQAGFNFALLP